MLAIAAPMATELVGIRRAIRDPQSRGLCLYVTGVGKKATIAGFAKLTLAGPKALILAGFCGGAHPNLQTSDLHIAGSFQHGNTGKSIAADAELSSVMLASARSCGVNVSNEPSATVSGIIGPSAKAELHHTSGIASVNMEDYWAASEAAAAGIPFASVRAILDTADQFLPEHLTGKYIHPARVALNSIIRPGRIPALMALALQSSSARRTLTRCVMNAIDALNSPFPVPTEALR